MAATPQVLFANTASGHVTSGGTGTPGTETMTVDAATAAAFPAASNTASPPTVFYFADPAEPSETMMCTNVSGTGNTSWAVTRGADGTIAIPHSSPFAIRGTVPAGVLASFQALLTNGLQAYFRTGSFTPSQTIGTYGPGGSPVTGASFTLTPPSGYRYFLPLHIWVQGVSLTAGSPGEVLTVSGVGTLEDTTSNGATITLAGSPQSAGGTTGGVVDSALLMVGFAGASSLSSGQTVTGTKRLASYLLQAKSSITGSVATVNFAFWAALIP